MRSLLFQDNEDAFFVADLADVVKKHQKWTSLLPQVEPHYGMQPLWMIASLLLDVYLLSFCCADFCALTFKFGLNFFLLAMYT